MKKMEHISMNDHCFTFIFAKATVSLEKIKASLENY
jgi:hypothetical protein